MDDELPGPSEALYFGGMELHGNVLFIRRHFGRKAARLYLKVQRRAARLYIDDDTGFSVRGTAGLLEPQKALAAARLRIALIDKLDEQIRTS